MILKHISPTARDGSNTNLFNEKPIITYYPVKLGDVTWACIQAACEICDQEVMHEDFRGTVSKSPSKALVSGISLCRHCNHYTPYEYTLDDQAVMSRKEGDNWVSYSAKPSFIELLQNWFKNLLVSL